MILQALHLILFLSLTQPPIPRFIQLTKLRLLSQRALAMKEGRVEHSGENPQVWKESLNINSWMI